MTKHVCRGMMVLVAGLALLWTGTMLAQTEDHLKCYKVKDPLKLRLGVNPRNVPWLDVATSQFGSENCRIVGGFRLFCAPASKDLKSGAFVESKLPGENFQPLALSPLGGDPESDKICYKIKCDEKLPEPPNPSLEVYDQFGGRTLSKLTPYLLCGPAAKGPAPPPPASSCPENGSSPPCDGYQGDSACRACCDTDDGCRGQCSMAQTLSCADLTWNEWCGKRINARGCASLCCPSP